jgi:hypothetical protein
VTRTSFVSAGSLGMPLQEGNLRRKTRRTQPLKSFSFSSRALEGKINPFSLLIEYDKIRPLEEKREEYLEYSF